MKLGFIFDTVMLRNKKKEYYTINLTYRLWQDRYLPVFDEMIVSTRVKDATDEEIADKKGYTIANGKNVQMHPITEYNEFTDVFFNRTKVKKQLEEVIEQVDCVIVRLPSPLGNLACDICRKKNKKYAIEMVACAWDGYKNHGHWAGKLVAPYMWWQTKKQCKKAKRVLYVTREFLQKRYPTHGVTTNASNVMINQSTQDVLENRISKINTSKVNYVMGLVGPLELKSKGHMIALKAIKALVKKNTNIKLELVGAGKGNKLREDIEKLGISKNVEIKGTIPGGEAMLNWMDQLDILVIPSFQEGLPRVLIEAMSRGCPAVGAKTGGIPELIRKDVIHKAGDYKKLTADIEKILQRKALAEELAKENYEEAKKYAKENLDRERKSFWMNFRDEDC